MRVPLLNPLNWFMYRGVRRAASRFARCSSACSVASTIFVLIRILVVFLQAVASIRAERLEDDELYTLCANGEGRSSSKMRHACLALASERSSPVIVLALSRTPNLFIGEVAGTFNLSTRAIAASVVVALIVFAPQAMSLRKWILGPTHVAPVEHVGGQHVVYLGSLAKSNMRRLMGNTCTRIEEDDEEEPNSAWRTISVADRPKLD